MLKRLQEDHFGDLGEIRSAGELVGDGEDFSGSGSVIASDDLVGELGLTVSFRSSRLGLAWGRA